MDITLLAFASAALVVTTGLLLWFCLLVGLWARRR